uniref:Uncharacterized protein n=1 Tax=Strigamia maritima TaxID=126957 RepID=T1J830_STRMM
MERGKPPAKRGPKTKAALPPPGDFIALGAKSSRSTPTTESVEPKLVAPKSSSSERKREAPSGPSLSLAAKKPKLAPTSSFVRPSSSKKEKDSKKYDAWDTVAIEVEPSAFLNQVHDAEENGNEERMVALVCGAIKNLRSNRAKPEAAMYLSLMFLAKTRPALFCHDYCVEAACTLLKRDATLNFKTKGNAIVSVLCANLLMAAFQDERQQWPDLFLTVYLEDALGERIWVDHDDCKGFVDNIQTAFNTKTPPKNMMQPEFGFKLEVCASPLTIQMDEDDTSESVTSTESREKQDVVTVPRYAHIQEQAENYILEIIREQIQRRQPMDNFSRNVLRVLTTASGFSEVRLIAATRMELWLQNPKLMRPAQELLLSVCLNCNQHNQQDVEVISHLIKIRLKTKPLINHYLFCIRELLNQHNDNLGTLLKHTIYNELSNSRNPNNMALLGVMFQFAPEQSAKLLAEVFQDLLTNKDDYLRALRALFREIVRSLRHDLNYTSFCLGLMQERKESQFKELDAAIKERLFHSVADLITLCVFMSITPNVRESASAVARGDRKDLNNLRNYQQMIASIQRDAVWWLQTIAPNMFKPAKNDFMHCVHKVLFMEQSDQYYNKDNWPPENDRMMMLRLASEIPVLEDTLMRLMIMGLSKDHPISSPDAHELVDQLIKRAAGLYSEEFQVIQVDRIDIIDVLFNICAYRYPENISLPTGYKPPNLAVSNLYWKAWILLLIVTAHNPATFGYEAWGKYPTLRNFIEMCITNHFTFPPPTMAVGEKADDLKSQELQIAHLEKQQIVEFENHLASASTKVAITESNSLLADQLTTLDPGGVARRPPKQILDQLTNLNESLKLGHLLCRSRNPDFLLEIIERQGTSQSMPWLADLVESSEGAFSVLPVQCLCEFLLNEPSDQSLHQSTTSDKEDIKEGSSKENSKAEKAEKAKKREKERKQKQLLKHLQSLLYESDEDSRPTAEVVDYFLRRLSSQQSIARTQAMKGLTLVVTPEKSDEEMETDSNHREQKWLTQYLPQLPHFESIRAATSVSLRQACQIETDPWVISAYVQYLANFAPDENLHDLADLALNMAQLIVERTTILNYILPSGTINAERRNSNLRALMIIFLKYVRKAREQVEQQWSESQDKIIIQWITGEAATMHILVVHAMVILLTYGPTTGYLINFV